MTGGLVTESDAIRTLYAGTYTMPELYEYVASRADIARDGGLEPPDDRHMTDTRWRRRVRGVLQNLREKGGARRVHASTWVIRGPRHAPRHLLLLAPAGRNSDVELVVRDATLLLATLDEPVDLVIADPPYGLGRGEDPEATRVYQRNHSQVVPGYVDVPAEQYGEFTHKWVSAAAAALRPGGTLAVITGPQRAAIVQCVAEDAGLSWLNSVAAFRQFALRTTRKFACSHWTITMMCRGRANSRRRVFNTPADLPKARSKADYPLDWWPECGKAERQRLLRYDNALPAQLVHRTIEACTEPGELVVDPCVGSGTTAIQAWRLGRRFIGADINPNAIRFAAARLLAENAWPAEAHPFPSTHRNGGQLLPEPLPLPDDHPLAVLERIEDPIEQAVIDVTLDHMAMKGWIDEPDSDLIGVLRDLYAANPSLHRPIRHTGDVLRDAAETRPGMELASLYEQHEQDRWEREEAERWDCACGFTFGLYPWSNSSVNFYTLTADGQFHSAVQKCPRCKRDLAKLRAERPGQLGFVL
jgi:DNA modification methylase